MTPLHQHEALIDNVRLRYLERDAGEQPAAAPLLLIHGLLATAETFGELIAGLPHNRRIIAVDVLSIQRTDSSPVDVHFKFLADLLYGLIQHLHLDHPVMIGHSHGGVLTLQLTANHPGLLSGMALLCPAHPFEGYRGHVVNFYLTRVGRFLALSIPLAPSWMILRAFNDAAGSRRRIHMRHLRLYMRVLRDRDTLRRVLQMLATWDADMDLLRRSMLQNAIATPALLIWGDEDPVVPYSTAAPLQQHLRQAELITVPGMGHLLAEEAPEECSALIAEWVTKLDSPT